MGYAIKNKRDLKQLLSDRASDLVYDYERHFNGDTTYNIYPYERGRDIAGAGLRYRFNDKGELIG